MSSSSALAVLAFAGLLSALPAFAEVPRLVAPEEVRALLTSFLERPELGDATEEAAFARRAQREAASLLATEGYFSPRVELRRDGGELVLLVDPGERSLIGEVHIELLGELSEARRTSLIAGWRLKPTQAFRQSEWDEAKHALLSDLLAVEHAGARLRETRAEVDPAARRVDLYVVAEAGPRYRFGELKISGLQRYPATLVARFNDSVKLGENYREDRLLALQNALQSTPYFSSASVTLERADDAADAPPVASDAVLTAPVLVRLRERSPYQVSLGGGYSTNTGLRMEATYRNSDVFSRAWELQSGLRVEQLRQTAYADLFFPPDERRRRDGLGTSFEESDIAGLAIRRFAVGAMRVQQRGSVEQRLSVNWQEEKRLPDGAPESASRALTALLAWTWRRAIDPLDPAEGVSLQVQLGGGSRRLLSDQDFLRTYLRYSQGIPLSARDALLLRGEVGATLAPSRVGIPQDFLFRAGGSNSVRGYAYQSLGVREGTATVGGRYLLTMSLEYLHWLSANWGAALFFDAGDAFDERRARQLAAGYGVGARWRSPAGPLGIDLAWGQRVGKLRLDFSLAIPF
ncbi:MAG: BamA/TamA family outer membrane protein [Candidatus Accumulibacter sp.]|uniref:autotransporter assembly complex protein TamA n=1 Tax=Accumulibacter sp. TaxID=2053492 RepID=UPI002878D948|nr:BamA/TamA family outer membrane protein [Accumulibacter sp.]MDS4014515.1 BamA/TamA family outer membrane protein [Accumulibacter sp.]